MNGMDMQALVDLCDPDGAKQRQWEEDRANGKRVTGFSKSTEGVVAPAPEGSMVTPGQVGPVKSQGPQFSKQKKKIKIDEADIWDEDEVAEGYDLAAIESRERPEYEFLHKQQVTSADMYLGLDFEKDPSSSCCDQLLLRILLPKESSASDIHLDVKPESIDLRSPHYRLLLPLPKRVLTSAGSAKWEADKNRMAITLVVDKSAQGTTKLI